jgi:hypothetical protein
MEITYDILRPIIKKEEINGNQIAIEFQAPGQLEPIQATGVVVPDQKDMMKSAGKQAIKTGVFYAAIRSISRLFGGAIGGTAGSIAISATSTVGYTVMSSTNNSQDMMKASITPEKQQAAVITAFNQVQSSFEWNNELKSWSGKN